MDTMEIKLLLLLRTHLQRTPLNRSLLSGQLETQRAILQLGECSQCTTRRRLRRHGSCGSTVSARRNSLLLGLVLLLANPSLGFSRTYQKTTRTVQTTNLMVDMHMRSSKLCTVRKGSEERAVGIPNVYKNFKELKDKMLFIQGSPQTVLEGP